MAAKLEGCNVESITRIQTEGRGNIISKRRLQTHVLFAEQWMYSPHISDKVFRRRLARFAELVLGQLCGSPLSKGCGVAAALAVCNRILAPLSLFFLEVSQAVKGGTAQEIPPADELVNIIIHNIHAGGICKDLLEQDTHF